MGGHTLPLDCDDCGGVIDPRGFDCDVTCACDDGLLDAVRRRISDLKFRAKVERIMTEQATIIERLAE